VNKEFGGMQEETVLAYFKEYYPTIQLEELRETIRVIGLRLRFVLGTLQI
jgi:hypothetical protein